MGIPPETINVYCDESSHLENDHQPLMVLGAVWGPAGKARAVGDRLREIKRAHGLPTTFEVKWSKVSPAKSEFYAAILEAFFEDADLGFRGVVAAKQGLDHSAFNQDHDTWYYKMYYLMLSWVLKPGSVYQVFVDIKDTRSAGKMRHLHDVLCSSKLDFDKEWIKRLQAVRSHEVEQVQLADLLIGALNYANQSRDGNAAKTLLVSMLRKRGYPLQINSSLSARKFNVFHWNPQAK